MDGFVVMFRGWWSCRDVGGGGLACESMTLSTTRLIVDGVWLAFAMTSKRRSPFEKRLKIVQRGNLTFSFATLRYAFGVLILLQPLACLLSH